mgnify:CR=1 FL=1
MFKFFSKKKAEPKQSESVCKITFSADNDGIIWIDCYWDTDKNPQAHVMLADMMQRVFSGSMTEESLEFIKRQCSEDGKSKELEEFLISLSGFHQEHMGKVMVDSLLDAVASKGTVPVVKPTDVLGGDIRNKKL